jgi:hypothetical protein
MLGASEDENRGTALVMGSIRLNVHQEENLQSVTNEILGMTAASCYCV